MVLCRGPVQLCQPERQEEQRPTRAPPPLSDRGRSILQQLMREGLGDHIFFLRLYQVRNDGGHPPRGTNPQTKPQHQHGRMASV